MTRPSPPSSSDPVDHDRAQLTVVDPDGAAGRLRPGRVGSREVARFAREVWGSADPLERLQRGVALAVDLVDGCDHAGVSVMSGGKPQPGPATDALSERADQLQQELDEGPRLDAVRTGETVTSQDLTREPRWERWSPLVVQHLGTRATMSLLLRDDTRLYGSLNLYSDRCEAWSRPASTLAQVLATHLTLALGDALQMEHRARAMVSRTVIGQAQGILMERFNITADAAYAVLHRTSQQNHRKIATVAADLVLTARLPDSSGDIRVPPVPISLTPFDGAAPQAAGPSRPAPARTSASASASGPASMSRRPMSTPDSPSTVSE